MQSPSHARLRGFQQLGIYGRRNCSAKRGRVPNIKRTLGTLTRPNPWQGTAGDPDFLPEVEATERAAHTRFVTGTGSIVEDLGVLTRCALVRSSLHQVIHTRGSWSRTRKYKRLRDQEERAIALGTFASRLPGNARAEVLGAALTLARRAKTTGEALSFLVTLVDESQRPAAMARALQAMTRKGDAESRAQRIRFAVQLPAHEAVELVIATLVEVDDDERESEWPQLGRIAVSLTTPVVEQLWSWSTQLAPSERHLVQSTICAGLAPGRRGTAAVEVLDGILEEREAGPMSGALWLRPAACWSAHAVVPIVPREGLERLGQVIEAADGLAPTLIVALCARLAALGLVERAKTLADGQPTLHDRESAWCKMLPHLAESERPELWRRLNDSIGDDSRVWRYLDENIEAWLAAVGADACLELVRRGQAKLPTGLTTSWPALVAIARVSPTYGPQITKALLAEADQIDPDDREVLFRLLPLLPYLPDEAARGLLADLLSCLGGYERSDLLNNWTGENLRALVPLVEHVAGDSGVYAVAKQVIDIGEWFP